MWDQVQASKLIESFLLGLPVPGVFLYKERDTNKLQIIDGQQRILTAIRFFRNDFDDHAFRLKNVQPKWDGKRFEDLDEADRFQLNDAVLRATVVQQLDPEDDTSIYHIFERLNTGGMKLNPMEIRKCVYLSDFYNLLEELNSIDSWRKLIGRPKFDKRLRDVEFVLRVLSFREKQATYTKPMKQFLNDYMAEKKRLKDDKLSEFLSVTKKEFTETCDFALAQLGEKAFHLRGRLNYAVLDSTMSTAFQAVQHKIDDFGERFKTLIKDKEYIDYVTLNTSDEKAVQGRFSKAKDTLLG